MSRQNYYPLIDIAKGVLIILVIVGHYLPGSIEANPLRFFIYTFHMPFFLGMSGYLLSEKVLEIKYTQVFLKYLNRMLLAWGIAWLACFAMRYGIQFKMSALFYEVIYPHYHLWFIPTLFLMISFVWLLRRIKINLLLCLFLVMGFSAAWLAVYSENPARGGPDLLRLLGDKRTYYYFPFFLTGFLLNRELKQGAADFFAWKTKSALLLLILWLGIWAGFGEKHSDVQSLVKAVCFVLFNCGLIMLVLPQLIKQENQTTSPILIWLGKNSLPLYLWHAFPIIGYQIIQPDYKMGTELMLAGYAFVLFLCVVIWVLARFSPAFAVKYFGVAPEKNGHGNVS